MHMPSVSSFTAPLRSKEAFLDAITTEHHGEHLAVGNAKWSNKDLEPTRPEERTWTWYNLPLYWGSTAFGTAGWNAAASLIAVGLTWRQAFASCVIGAFISALVVTGMARPGVRYHIGYPVLCRSVMGMYGSMFFIFIRAIVGAIWYGIQSYYGANLMSTCLRCIFGYKWENWDNTLPPSADVTSKQLLCFFLVWLMELPLCFVHPRRIHYLFTVKGLIMPFTTFGLFGWCMAHGTGLATIDAQNAAGAKVAATTATGWAIMNGINVVMGTLSPMLVNQPDLARYCKKPRDAGWLQGFAVFFSKVLIFFLGLATTSSIQGAYGKAYWNMWDLNNAILDHNWNPTARFGIFLVSFSYLFSVFGTNLGANSIPFGADMTGLFPKYLTIRRGQVLCAFLGVALVPWKLIATAQTFITFLGSYNIFMAPLCAIIIIDYCFARKGNIHVPSLYQGSKSGLYWFTGGVNILGVFAWIAGTVMGLPGLVAAYNPKLVPQGGKDMYKMGWVLTFITAGTVYFVLIKIRKPRVFPTGFEDVPVSWEYLALEGRDGFFDGERGGYAGYSPRESIGEGVSQVEEKPKGIY
ncbi:NCS1 nucleoside transporter [Trematosphaeria pertusa]|uniref:NCS1 nucleoside transporter n=1 Tax=Trematosphaeria pertusa TaxID=390896 RepID=A0A6A6HZ68_9PLEO|nr:NCS1 nucleoside transporter [Trematosphaeria pertusa]KAF2243068.1 NCS1 nucleoside transporter [Trematosphaeria pertusa]